MTINWNNYYKSFLTIIRLQFPSHEEIENAVVELMIYRTRTKYKELPKK